MDKNMSEIGQLRTVRDSLSAALDALITSMEWAENVDMDLDWFYMDMGEEIENLSFIIDNY